MVDQALKRKMVGGLRQYLDEEGERYDPHQLDAFNDFIDHLDRPISGDNAATKGKKFDGASGEMATGSGKTWIELGTAIGMGQKALFITPLTKLNTQIRDTYTMADKLGMDSKDIAVYDSNQSATEKRRAKEAKILITTDKSFQSLHRDGVISGNPEDEAYRSLLVLDESDAVVGPETKKILRQNYTPNCVTLALSATDDGVSDALFDGQPRFHELSPHDAVKRGILAYGVHTAALQVHPRNISAAEYKAALKEEDYPEGLLERFANNPVVINAIMNAHATYEDKPDPEHGKEIGIGPIRRFPTLITVPRIDTSNKYAREFNKYFGDGYATAVSGLTPHDDLEDPATIEKIRVGLNTFLKRFNEGGSPRVMIFPDVLGRGTDIANATVLFSVRPYKKMSPVKQHLGRILRKGDADYYEKYGNDKVGLAINVYAPEMKPILFSQALGGPVIYSEKKPPRKREVQPPVAPAPSNLPPATWTNDNQASASGIDSVDTSHPTSSEPDRLITNISKLKALYQDAELVRMEREGIVPPGWVTFEQALEITGINSFNLNRYVSRIQPGKNYTIIGRPAGAEGVSSNLTDDYPAESLVKNTRGKRLLNEEMVQRWARIQQRIEQQHGKGAGTAADVAREQKVPISRVKSTQAYIQAARPNVRAIEQLADATKDPDKPRKR